MKRILLLTLFTIVVADLRAQTEDTIYFDANWKKTEKAGASYYRTAKEIRKGFYAIADCYINGQVQMSGYSTDYTSEKSDYNDSLFMFYDPSGYKDNEGSFVKGKKTGEWKFYYPRSNKLRSTYTYVDDKIKGWQLDYDSATGNLWQKGMIKDGKREGEWTLYYTNSGKLQGTMTYKNDKGNGPLKTYDSLEGNLMSDGIMEDDKRVGEWKFYDMKTGNLKAIEDHKLDNAYGIQSTEFDVHTGKRIASGFFINKKQNGPNVYYYKDGDRVKGKLTYNLGHIIGKATFYDSLTQTLIKESEYNNDGKRTGEWRYYSASGKLTVEEHYKNSELDGDIIEYDTLLNAKSAVSRYRSGKKNGNWTANYPNTLKLWLDYNFKDDSLDGTLIAYYPSGKLKRKEVYDNGRLISSRCLTESGEEMRYIPMIIKARFIGDVMIYIGNDLHYPKEAEGIEGRVLIGFVVNEDGSIADVNVIQGVDDRLDKEAVRLVSEMPRWVPGRIDGIRSKDYRTLPIVFWKH